VDETVVGGENIDFFELQLKTLFQHAWSEADHDLGYKPSAELSLDQKRRLAFTAAQAWGADLIFDELYREIAFPS
jgi:putative GTP pyrophosphokinase